MTPIYHFSTFAYLEVMRPNQLTFHPITPLPIKEPVHLPIQLTHVSWTALITCTMVTIVPSPLFEPRYYILPYFFWRIFITCSCEPLIKDLNLLKKAKPNYHKQYEKTVHGIFMVHALQCRYFSYLFQGLISLDH